jgi:hypothetical protein
MMDLAMMALVDLQILIMALLLTDSALATTLASRQTLKSQILTNN